MSGRRAKARRRATKNQPADHIIAIANQMLALDLSGVPVTRQTQFIVGWMRAAYDQSRIIATLTRDGLAHAAAPNRRAFAELAFRMLWLRTLDKDTRSSALDTVIENEKRLTTGFYDAIKEMGFDHQTDLSAMETVVVEVLEDKALRQQVKSVTDAARAAPTTIGLYSAWREETQYTHATAHLAIAYAPEDSTGQLGRGEPPLQHGDLETHHMVSLLIGTLTGELLRDAGVDDDTAWPIVAAAWNAK